MKKHLVSLCLSIFVLACTSCQKELCLPDTPTASAIRILPLGDSRVEGFRPDYESYRYELWKLLTQNAWETNFIGSREDDAKYDEVDSKCFDNDHEGTGGAATTDILATLEDLQLEVEAEIVLLGIGAMI